MTVRERAIKELYYWQMNYTGCFVQKLFDLIQKADTHNRDRLYKAFPEEVSVLEEWKAAKTSDEFFERYGFHRNH